MAAFAHKVEVKLGEDARKSVGIVEFESFPIMRSAMDLVTRGRGGAGMVWWQDGFEKAFVAQLHGFDDFRRWNADFVRCKSLQGNAGLLSPRDKKAYRAASLYRMRPEKGEGVGMTPCHDRVNLRIEAWITRSDRFR
jgi:hypothetical protein